MTPDRTISRSYDWLRLGQGATDRQFMLRYPAAVDWRISIAGNRATSGSDQRPMYDQS